MNPENRASCDDIVRRFEEFHEACKASADYCVKKFKTPPIRSRTDSSLLVGDGISPLQKRMLQKVVMQDQHIQLTRVTTPEHTTLQSVFDSQSESQPHPVVRGPSFSQEVPSLLDKNKDCPFIKSVGTGSSRRIALNLDQLGVHEALDRNSSDTSRSTERITQPETLNVPDGTDDEGSTWTGNTLRMDHHRNRVEDGKLHSGLNNGNTQQGGRQRHRLRHGFSKFCEKLRSVYRPRVKV